MLPLCHAHTQTDSNPEASDWPDVGLSRKRFSGAPPIIDLGEEGPGGSGDPGQNPEPPLDWKGRCRKLERVTEEMEKEKMRLMEIRLRLELELQKLKCWKQPEKL